MKKTLAFILCLGFGLAFAQAEENKTQPVQTAPISHAKAGTENKNPEFPGGLLAFRNEFVSNFRPRLLQAAGIQEASATATFLIEKDGSISNIKIESRDNEIIKDEFIRALKKISTKWIPGEKNGVPVRIMVRQPLIFKTVK